MGDWNQGRFFLIILAASLAAKVALAESPKISDELGNIFTKIGRVAANHGNSFNGGWFVGEDRQLYLADEKKDQVFEDAGKQLDLALEGLKLIGKLPTAEQKSTRSAVEKDALLHIMSTALEVRGTLVDGSDNVMGKWRNDPSRAEKVKAYDLQIQKIATEPKVVSFLKEKVGNTGDIPKRTPEEDALLALGRLSPSVDAARYIDSISRKSRDDARGWGSRLLHQMALRNPAGVAPLIRERLANKMQDLVIKHPKSFERASTYDLQDDFSAVEGVKDPLVVKYLQNLAQSRNPDIRAHVIRTLGTIEDKSSLPILTRALADKSQKVRAGAIEGLSQIGGKEAIAAILPHLSEKTDHRHYQNGYESMDDVTGRALLRLADRFPNSIEAKRSMTALKGKADHSTNRDFQATLTIEMGRRGDYRYVLDSLKSPSASRRSGAAQALTAFFIPKATKDDKRRSEMLDALMAAHKKETDGWARLMILDAITLIGEPEGMPTLIAELKDTLNHGVFDWYPGATRATRFVGDLTKVAFEKGKTIPADQLQEAAQLINQLIQREPNMARYYQPNLDIVKSKLATFGHTHGRTQGLDATDAHGAAQKTMRARSD